jgi:hypothetical protein
MELAMVMPMLTKNDISSLDFVKARISEGKEISQTEFDSIDWASLISKDFMYNDLWQRVRLFVDDYDIRAKEIQYDAKIRNVVLSFFK